MSDVYIFPEEKSGRGGGGPEDDPRYPENAIRSQGFYVIAFALALGIAFLVFFGLYYILIKRGHSDDFVTIYGSIKPQFDWLMYFLYGFLGGILISGMYNFLVIRRLTLFGLESGRD